MKKFYRKFTIVVTVLLFINIIYPILPLGNVRAEETGAFQEKERVDLRTPYADVYQTGGNEYRLEESSGKVYYGTKGNYKPINNNMIVSPSGEYKFRNSANDFVFRAGADLSSGIYFVGGGKSCKLKFDSADGLEPNNAVGAISGNKLTYSNIYPSTDLEFTIDPNGVSTEIVIKDASVLKDEIKFELINCNATQLDKAIIQDNDSGAYIPQAVVQEEDGTKLVLDPDYSKLSGIDGEVRIDPSLSISSNVDTFVSSSSSNPANGNRRAMFIGTYEDFTINCSPTPWCRLFQDSRALMNFGTLSLPTGAVVQSGSLSLYHYGTNSGHDRVHVARVTSGWSETTVWSGPSFEGDYGGSTFPTYNSNSTAVLRSIAIDNSLITALRSANNGVMVKNDDDNQAGVVVCSSDIPSGPCKSGMEPKIVVNYIINQNPDTPNPQSPVTNSTYSGNCDESVTPATGICRTTTSVTTQAKVNDPDTIAAADMNHSNFYFTGANVFNSPNIAGDGNVTISYTGDFVDGLTNWRVRSIDNQGALSAFSPTFIFTTDTTPPTVPAANALPEFTAGVGIDATSQVDPTAAKSTDNVSTQANIYYTLEYSTTADFSSNIYSNAVWQQDNAGFQVGPKGFDGIASTADDIADGGTYYFRIKAKDGLNNISAYSNVISTTIDATKPVLSDISSVDTRFSPNNTTSIGVKDTATIDLTYVENHPQSAKLEIRDGSNNIVKTITQDISANEGVATPVNLQFIWDGKDDANNFLSDGSFTINAVITDKAGNVNDVSQTLIVIVDNNEANITISSPVNNYWTNQSFIDVNGQVNTPDDAGENDDDLSIVEVQKTGSGNWAEIIPDALKFFSITRLLDLGKNDLEFRTTDTVGNIQIKPLTINSENTAPVISNVSPSTLTNNTKPVISFDAEDPDPTSDGTQKSDIPSGTNPYKMAAWLTFDTWDSGTSSYVSNTKKLIEDGVNFDSALISDLTCNPASGAVASTINGRASADKLNCSLSFISDLQPDTTYTIHVKFQDNAENETTKEDISFELDSHQFSQVSAPIDGSVYSNSSVLFKGKGAKDSTLTIANTQLGQSQTFTLNDSLNGTGQDGTFIMSNFIVTCGEFIDFDGRADTKDEEVCNWEVYVKQAFANSNTNTLNQNVITLTDAANNSVVINKDINVNIYAFTLEVSSSLNYFSPNGDGRQDNITFTHSATSSPVPPVIDYYELRIKDSSNNVIRSFSGNGFLQPNSFWDGKDGSGNFVVDGTYTYELYVRTSDNAEVTTSLQYIYSVTNLSDSVVITNPINNSVTTYGVITVQGQGPQSGPSEGTVGVLRGTVTIRICVDTITIPNSSGCDTEVETTTDSNGFFTAIVILTRPDGLTQINHNITAYAYDQFGNQTPNSNLVTVIQDTLDPFKSVSITPALTGVSDPILYQKFLDGDPSVTINDLRSIILKSNVTQNTEWVDLSFADFTNLSERPDSPSYSFIGTQSGPCADPAGCSWETTYPVPSNFGGIYEVNFKGKKGDTIQNLTAGFKADGSIPAAPIILVVEKFDTNTNNWVKITDINDIYYTKDIKIRIRGAAEPNIDLKVFSKGTYLGNATVASSGVWEYEVDLSTYLDNLSSTAMSCVQASGASCVVADFDFSVEVDDPIYPTPSVNTKQVRYDSVAPSAINIGRTTPVDTIPGWLRSGDSATYTLVSDEALSYTDLIKEDGYTLLLTNLSAGTSWGGTITMERSTEGYYLPKIRLIDFAGNRTDYDASLWNTYGLGDFRLYVDNTLPDSTIIDKSNWSTTWAEGGVNADGINPEMGRTNPEYVLKGNVVNITGKAERNQRVQIYVNNEFKITIPVIDQDCVGDSSQDITAVDGLVVKYAETCTWTYDFTFPGDGTSGDIFGVPFEYYIFQVRVVDNALNTSAFSKQEIVYHDTRVPFKPEVINIASASYNPIRDFVFNASSPYSPVTKDTSINVESNAERFSDLQYYLLNPQGSIVANKMVQNETDQTHIEGFDLGTSVRDQSKTECMQVINGRRYGICGDGNYALLLVSTDAAGNSSPFTVTQVERDTVSPVKPNVSLSIPGNLSAIYMSMAGEPGTIVQVGGISNVVPSNGLLTFIVKTLSIYNDADWERTFTFGAYLTDRAGNQSEVTYASIPTPVRPPRPGECQDSLNRYFSNLPEENAYSTCVQNGDTCSDEQRTQIAKDIVNNMDSKSCRHYASDQLVSSLSEGMVKGINNFNTVSTFNSCLQTKIGEQFDKAKDQQQYSGFSYVQFDDTNWLFRECNYSSLGMTTDQLKALYGDYLKDMSDRLFYVYSYDLGSKKSCSGDVNCFISGTAEIFNTNIEGMANWLSGNGYETMNTYNLDTLGDALLQGKISQETYNFVSGLLIDKDNAQFDLANKGLFGLPNDINILVNMLTIPDVTIGDLALQTGIVGLKLLGTSAIIATLVLGTGALIEAAPSIISGIVSAVGEMVVSAVSLVANLIELAFTSPAAFLMTMTWYSTFIGTETLAECQTQGPFCTSLDDLLINFATNFFTGGTEIDELIKHESEITAFGDDIVRETEQLIKYGGKELDMADDVIESTDDMVKLSDDIVKSSDDLIKIGDEIFELGDDMAKVGDDAIKIGNETFKIEEIIIEDASTLKIGDQIFKVGDDFTKIGGITQFGDDVFKLGDNFYMKISDSYMIKVEELGKIKSLDQIYVTLSDEAKASDQVVKAVQDSRYEYLNSQGRFNGTSKDWDDILYWHEKDTAIRLMEEGNKVKPLAEINTAGYKNFDFEVKNLQTGETKMAEVKHIELSGVDAYKTNIQSNIREANTQLDFHKSEYPDGGYIELNISKTPVTLQEAKSYIESMTSNKYDVIIRKDGAKLFLNI